MEHLDHEEFRMTAVSKIIARVDRKRMLRREFMMDRVDSTTAWRVAARGALNLSKLLPILLVAYNAAIARTGRT